MACSLLASLLNWVAPRERWFVICHTEKNYALGSIRNFVVDTMQNFLPIFASHGIPGMAISISNMRCVEFNRISYPGKKLGLQCIQFFTYVIRPLFFGRNPTKNIMLLISFFDSAGFVQIEKMHRKSSNKMKRPSWVLTQTSDSRRPLSQTSPKSRS